MSFSAEIGLDFGYRYAQNKLKLYKMKNLNQKSSKNIFRKIMSNGENGGESAQPEVEVRFYCIYKMHIKPYLKFI